MQYGAGDEIGINAWQLILFVMDTLGGDPFRAAVTGELLGISSFYDDEPTFRQPWQRPGEQDPLRSRFLASSSAVGRHASYTYPPHNKAASDIQVAFSNVGGIAGIGALIGKYESGGDYNKWNGGTEVPITRMTVDQVIARQAHWREIPGATSSAAGKYQIIRSTLISLKQEMGLTGNELMDGALQEKFGVQLMARRGLNDFLNGRITTREFMANLSKEWAGLPKDLSGRSYYAGVGNNAAHVSPHTVIAVLENAREQYQRQQQLQYAESEAAKKGTPKNFKDNAGDVEGNSGPGETREKPVSELQPTAPPTVG